MTWRRGDRDRRDLDDHHLDQRLPARHRLCRRAADRDHHWDGRNVVEASTSSREIAGNISGVADAAESTTQAVNQTRTAVDELARMAAETSRQVSQFRY